MRNIDDVLEYLRELQAKYDAHYEKSDGDVQRRFAVRSECVERVINTIESRRTDRETKR